MFHGFKSWAASTCRYSRRCRSHHPSLASWWKLTWEFWSWMSLPINLWSWTNSFFATKKRRITTGIYSGYSCLNALAEHIVTERETARNTAICQKTLCEKNLVNASQSNVWRSSRSRFQNLNSRVVWLNPHLLQMFWQKVAWNYTWCFSYEQGRTQGFLGVDPPLLILMFYKNFITFAKEINCFRILFAC